VTRFTVLGVPVDPLTEAEAVDWVARAIIEGRPRLVISVNPERIMHAGRDRAFAAVLRGADLALADGAGAVWAARRLGHGLPERVAGVDFDEAPSGHYTLKTNVQGVRDLVYAQGNNSVAPYWLNQGADGWRLDVMSDPSFPVDYWQQFRVAVKTAKPDAPIIAEAWKKDEVLPKVHGDAVCATLVGSPSQARILMLTAAGTVDDRVDGLNLGADDYLVKPFAFAELVARVRSLARRSPAAAPVITRGDLLLDRARRRVSRAGRPVPLNRKEMAVLEELMVADGGVLSAEDLLERVWDENADLFTRTVTVTIGRLRRKLGEPDPIETVIGTGYRLP